MPSQPPEAAIAALASLLNTADRYNGTDALGDVAEARRSLRSSGLLAAEQELDAAALVVLRDVRESLRGLAAANTQQRQPAPELFDELDRSLSSGHLQLRVRPAAPIESVLEPAVPGNALDSALAIIAAAIHDAVQAGVWQRLKACANEDCRWVFYDRSRSRTGRWCDMRACGNLLKARAYRQRQRSSDAG